MSSFLFAEGEAEAQYSDIGGRWFSNSRSEQDLDPGPFLKPLRSQDPQSSEAALSLPERTGGSSKVSPSLHPKAPSFSGKSEREVQDRWSAMSRGGGEKFFIPNTLPPLMSYNKIFIPVN